MKITVLWSITLLTICPLGNSSLASKDHIKKKEEPEVQWAKNILKDFFDNGIFGANTAAFGLLSPELAKTYPTIPDLFGIFGLYQSVTFDEYSFAPDKSEIIFKGFLQPHEVLQRKKEPLIIRVAKESQGRWSIRYIRLP